jgi:flavin reductase (DIM6/NTAB) family NADH-FMN oxidoreductase RutF
MSDSTDRPDLASALGRVVSGLSILTLNTVDGSTGMLSSWVQQCSFSPPRVSVAIRSDREIWQTLQSGAQFTLNLLAEGQNALVGHFAKGFEADQNAFEGLKIHPNSPFGPILLDALAYLCCRVVDRVRVGDHDLLIAEVLDGKMLTSDVRPYVHVRKNGLKY